MNSIKYDRHDDELDNADDQDTPTFQRLKKQTGKTTTIKDDRRQAAKEFGKRIGKFHKERRRYEGRGKP